MGELKKQTLYCTEGGADKQYTIWLEEHAPKDGSSEHLFTVETQWGPRGGHVSAATKTPAPVPLDRAQKLYDKIVSEKMGKGYHLGEDAPAYSQVSGAVDSGIRPMLLTDATEIGEETFILSNEWIAQEKMNGKRIMLRISSVGGMVTVAGVNRRGLECPIPKGVKDAPFPYAVGLTVLDGELIGEKYHVFDMVQQADVNLRDEKMIARAELLSTWLGDGLGQHVKLVPIHVGVDQKRALVEKLRAGRREGVVFKNTYGVYDPGRIENLKKALAVKVKFYSETTLKILRWNDKSSLAIAALGSDGLDAPCGNVTVPAKYVAEIKTAMESPTGYRNAFIRVRYLYATANRILYQPNLDPDSAGRVIRDDAAEADLLSSLKLEGKGEEE